MPSITLSDKTYAKLKAVAEPFVDTEDSAAARALDFYLEHKQKNAGNGQAESKHPSAHVKGDVVRLPIGTRELTHTRLVSATLGGSALGRPDWNSLLRDIHILARKRLGSFDAVHAASGANLRNGRYEADGYRYLPQADMSIQGCDANHSCEYAFGLARAMRISLFVSFEWRDKEEASHPGRTGLIEWIPPAASEGVAQDERAVHDCPVTWHDAVKAAIQRIAGNRATGVFKLAELRQRELASIVKSTGSLGATPERTLERVCQELRDSHYIDFVDNDGTYRLRR